MMTTTVKALMTHVAPCGQSSRKCTNKVSVVGAGSVGTAIAFALLAQVYFVPRNLLGNPEDKVDMEPIKSHALIASNITSELVLIDKNESLGRGEMLDIQHATMYLNSPLISSSTDYSSSADSKICIVTAGATVCESNKELTARQNTEIFKEIIPELVKYSPNAILVICSQPVDIMTYVAWKLSNFAPYRVVGSGTILESARLRYLIAQRLEVEAGACQAFVIGEHGRKSVPVWSAVSVSGVRLREVNPNLGTDCDPEDWQELHKQVVESAEEVNRLKQCGSWGMALSISRLVRAIIEDSRECFPISTHVKGCRHGVDKDVFMSLPCIIGSIGVVNIVRQNLSDMEKDMIQKSADFMHELQKKLIEKTYY